MISPRDRARGCLLGLAAGDALGAPAENLTPEEIRRRWGRLTEIEGGGTDDTEYAIFAASLLVRHGHALTAADVAAAYRAEVIPSVRGADARRRVLRAGDRRSASPRARTAADRAGALARLVRRAGHAGGAVRDLLPG
ncbi:ADP-ribosylglycohydrolase family protein [Nonomuraea salmonea]|uniref:ADP-ribosylglycohydrolase family protein n=1 Tax=Nonomuraea salmonea TaxID=46181 RepID=UPI002FEA01AE